MRHPIKLHQDILNPAGKKTAEFLKGIGELFSALSLHEKHQTYISRDLSGATVRVARA